MAFGSLKTDGDATDVLVAGISGSVSSDVDLTISVSETLTEGVSVELSELVIGEVDIVALEVDGISLVESNDSEEGSGKERNLHCCSG